VRISLADQCGKYLGRSEGSELALFLRDNIPTDQLAEVDFAGVDTALPSFFNALIGTLAENQGLPWIGERLKPVNMSDLLSKSWANALKNASISDAEAESMWSAAEKSLLG
jgi:hypothetical protein